MKSMNIAGVTLLALGLLFPCNSPGQDLEIYNIEVGLNDAGFYKQGNSTLIIGPDGTTVLIDGGAAGASGGDTVTALMDSRLGLTDLDYMIATHWDEDHYLGLVDVGDYSASMYLPTTIYDLGDAASEASAGYNSTFSGRMSTPSVGNTIALGDGATLTFVAVDGDIHGGGYVDPDGHANARSIGVLIQYGGFDYLSCGDLEGINDSTHENTEGPLAAALAGDGYEIDILHVDHHGSRFSTFNDYCSDLEAEYAVISCGDGQSYGHPHQYVINHLNALDDGGSPASPVYPAVTEIYILEDPGEGTAANVTTVGTGHDFTASQQGSLHITVESDGVGAQFSFANEGPNTNAISDGPYDSDEGGITSGLLDEDFESGHPPAGWLESGTDLNTSPTNYNSPTNCLRINANGDYLTTPLLTAPDELTFWYRGTSGNLNVEYASGVGGPWTDVSGSPFAGTGSKAQETSDISAYTNIYLRFTRVPSAGIHYIDDVSVSELIVATPTWTPSSTPTSTPTPTMTPTPTITSTPTQTPNYLMFEDFESGHPPTGWLENTTDLNTSPTNYNSPTNCVRFNATGDYMITPILTTPDILTFWYRGTSQNLEVKWSSSQDPGGTWNHVSGSPFAATGSKAQETSDISAYTDIYLRFNRDTTSGTHYVDDVGVTNGGGGPAATATPTVTRTPTPTPTSAITSTPTATPTGPTPTPGQVISINFQPAASSVPAGYLVDSGGGYALQGGETYGWR